MARFPHIPREAVLKEDLLGTGFAFDESALTDNLDGEIKPKSYFIFSFDQKPLAELGEAARRRPPEEVAFSAVPHALRRTSVSGRVHPASPYRVARDGGALRLSLEGHELADVALPPMPEYYRHTLANGKTVMETAPTIQWGYLIYLTVLRLCQYFGAHEECGFCDINHNWRQHKREGRPYTGVKPVEDVLEALALIDRYDEAQASRAYTLTGGSITSAVDGLAEADFYGRYAQAIEERFPKRWIGKVVAQALPREDVQRYKDYGITIYHPNYEVWDKRLFSLISPGKQRYVGRPAGAMPPSRAARSWTASIGRLREARHGRRGEGALERGLRRRAEGARAGGARSLARAGPRHVHGDADHQLHERLRCSVRLLRLLRAPEPGRRLRPLARGGVRENRRAGRVRRRPRRLQRRLQSAAAARLLLRPVRLGARALRRPGRVLCADNRRARLSGRPRRAQLLRGGGAPPRRRRALGDRRRH